MKADEFFYKLFLRFPGAFFGLTVGSPQMALNYKFISVEVKKLSFRFDGVFEPDPNHDGPVWFVEAQMQPKKDLYERLFTEAFIYLRQHHPQRDWRAAVFYPTRSIEHPDEYGWYREFFESGRVQRVYLDELSPTTSLEIELARLVVLPPTQVGSYGRELVQKSRAAFPSLARQKDFLELVVDITVQKLPQKKRAENEKPRRKQRGIDSLNFARFAAYFAQQHPADAVSLDAASGGESDPSKD